MKIEKEGIVYEIVIIDKDICLQSRDRDVLIQNGYTMLRDQAEESCNAFHIVGYEDAVQSYTDSNIFSFCYNRFEEATVIIYE